jgi:hypothetical protein
LQKQKLKSISLTNTKRGGDGDENLPIINKTKHSTKGERKEYEMEGPRVLGGLMSFSQV